MCILGYYRIVKWSITMVYGFIDNLCVFFFSLLLYYLVQNSIEITFLLVKSSDISHVRRFYKIFNKKEFEFEFSFLFLSLYSPLYNAI